MQLHNISLFLFKYVQHKKEHILAENFFLYYKLAI
jgi:hypothetical protein